MSVLLFQILPVVILLILGFSVGSLRERGHFRSLARREQELSDIGVVNLRTVAQPESVRAATLVTGDAVIATDYFKGFMAGLRNIVGGEVRSYQTLMTRARREATVRMLTKARDLGATEVWNVRYETSNILSGAHKKRVAVSVEVFAFGTAVIRG